MYYVLFIARNCPPVLKHLVHALRSYTVTLLERSNVLPKLGRKSTPTLDVTKLGVDLWGIIVEELSLRDVVQLSMVTKYTHSLGLIELCLSRDTEVTFSESSMLDLFVKQHCHALCKLTIGGMTEIAELGVGGPKLVSLNVLHCSNVSSIYGTGRHLSNLWILSCLELRHVSLLSTCQALGELEIEDCPNLVDIAPISECISLLWLRLRNCKGIESIAPLAYLPKLHSLDISGCRLLNIEVLPSLPKLEYLDMHDCYVGDLDPYPPGFYPMDDPPPMYSGDIWPLAGCKALEVLNISKCDCITNITPLSQCTRLESLMMDESQVDDLEPLAGCSSLEILSLQKSLKVDSLFPLSACERLCELNIADCPLIDELWPLSDCQVLYDLFYSRDMDLDGIDMLRSEGVDLYCEEEFVDERRWD